MSLPDSSATPRGVPNRSLPDAAAAGPLRRLLATLADMVLFCGLCAVLAWPVITAVDWTTLPTDVDGFISTVSDGAWISHASGVLGMWIALWWCYFVVGWGLFGATPGKWLFGLRIVDHKDRYPIGISRALMRLFSYGVSSITLGAGHLLAVIRGNRMALHDSLAGTRVVRTRRSSSNKEIPPVSDADRRKPHEPPQSDADRGIDQTEHADPPES